MARAVDYITQDSFTVIRCRHCDSYFTFPVPEHAETYYPRMYRQYARPVWFLQRFIYKKRVRRWIRCFTVPARVLEIGCGEGHMLKTFQLLGWSVQGTERTDKTAGAARAQGLPISTGAITNLQPAKAFDLILIFHALEHLESPSATLMTCADLLSKNGQLIISVPNFDSWQSRWFRDYWFHLDVPRHLHHFTANSLERLIAPCGLTTKRMVFDSLEQDAYGWMQSLLNALTGSHNVLTRGLSKMDAWTLRHTLHLATALLFAPLCLLAVILSWIARKGAIMEIHVTRKRV